MLEQTYHVGLSKVRMVCNLVHAIIDLNKYSPPATEGQGNSFVNLFMGIGYQELAIGRVTRSLQTRLASCHNDAPESRQ